MRKQENGKKTNKKVLNLGMNWFPLEVSTDFLSLPFDHDCFSSFYYFYITVNRIKRYKTLFFHISLRHIIDELYQQSYPK